MEPKDVVVRGGWTCLRSGAGSLTLTSFLAAARQQSVLVRRHWILSRHHQYGRLESWD